MGCDGKIIAQGLPSFLFYNSFFTGGRFFRKMSLKSRIFLEKG